jgi:ubiquinone/menaquinone biosynthesis C-methylase UbiE
MRELLRNCERMSWQQALERVADTLADPLALLQDAVSPGRAAWWPLLNLQPSWRVLELGCEWGAITFSLAPMVAAVVACDLNLQRLRFLKARALQDNTSNVRSLCAGDAARLPFGDKEFDLIILNGVLEKVPLSRSGWSLGIQRAFLREAARVLAPEGQLLLVGRNRWRRQSSKPFRGYPHSFWGFKLLLRSAGFVSTKAFIPLPNFQSFKAIVDPSRKQTVEHYFAEREVAPFEAIWLKARSSLAPLLASSFGWIATRGNPQTSFLESLGRQVTQALSGASDQPIEWLKFRVTWQELITLELRIHGISPSVILRIPLTSSSNRRTSLEYQGLNSLRERLVSPGRWPEIPRPLLQGTFNSVPYFVQEGLPGFSGVRFLRAGHRANKWKELALDFIVRLHSATRTPVNLDEATWNEAVMPLLDAGLQSTEEFAGISSASIRDYLMQELVGHQWPFVFSHGDFWAGNLLFDQKGDRLLGVIDWDRSLPYSLPLTDLLHLLLSARAEVEQTRPTDLFGKALLQGLDQEERQLVDRYLQQMGFSVSFQQLKAFLLLDWLLRVSTWVSSRQSLWWRGSWLRNNVEPSAVWLKQLFGAAEARPLSSSNGKT